MALYGCEMEDLLDLNPTETKLRGVIIFDSKLSIIPNEGFSTIEELVRKLDSLDLMKDDEITVTVSYGRGA